MSHLLDIRCPSCQSKQLSTTEKSGGRLTLTCLSCGYIFKAIDTDTTPQKMVEQPLKSAVREADTVPINTTPDLGTLNQRIIEIAQSAGKLSAVKYCKDNTGRSLNQCKEYVDQLVDKGQINQWDNTKFATVSGPEESGTMAQRVIEIARTKGRLQAVKYYKDRMGTGLKEALEYVDKIVPPATYKKTEGCFVATACYGDYDASEVLVLRCYRDNVLQQSKVGRLMVRLYYRLSPSFARFIQDKNLFKKIMRQHILQPLVKKLSENS